MGQRTLKALITQVREILQDRQLDEFDEYRYSDSDLVGYLNSGIAEIARVRPDATFAYIGTDLPLYTVADVEGGVITFPLDDIFFTVMVNFVAGYAELRDDTFTVDGRATALISALLTGLSVPPKPA